MPATEDRGKGEQGKCVEDADRAERFHHPHLSGPHVFYLFYCWGLTGVMMVALSSVRPGLSSPFHSYQPLTFNRVPFFLVAVESQGLMDMKGIDRQTAAKNERIADILLNASFCPFLLAFKRCRIRLPLDPLTYQSWNRMPVHLSLLSLACDSRADMLRIQWRLILIASCRGPSHPSLKRVQNAGCVSFCVF